MRADISFVALLLVGTACSAQGLPRNAPLDPALKNVPATTGRANLPKSTPPFTVTTIGQFDAPFAMAFLPDGGLLVTEKAGRIKLRLAGGKVIDVAGVPAVAFGGQGGLLDIAVAPDFAQSRALYISYSSRARRAAAWRWPGRRSISSSRCACGRRASSSRPV